MEENKEIILSETVRLGTVQASSPQNVIELAKPIASALAGIINDRKLYTVINGKKYVQVDGWSTLGAMLGVLPIEVRSEKIDGGYESYVELKRTSDGMVIGGASAICTRDEKNWSSRDEYAIKSMATTRATGKAYRLAFSWIMNLAGYESTPAEEMISAEFTEVEQPKHKPIGKQRPYDPETLKSRIDIFAAKHAGETASDGQRGLMVVGLNTVYAGPDADIKRHEALQFLTGEPSSQKVKDEFILAILDWLHMKKDSDGAYIPDEMAAREAQTLLSYVRRKDGTTPDVY